MRAYPSHATWVCFGCRVSIRRVRGELSTYSCAVCGESMSYLGDRLRISPKRDLKGWQALWTFIHTGPQPITGFPAWLKAMRVQYLERKIAHLEGLRGTEARKLQLLSLRRQLTRLTNA